MRATAAAALCAAVFWASLGACRPPPPEPWGPGQRANVLLIVVDSLRRDHLGCYGYRRPTSSNIDRLAAAGVLYERAYSQAPWTTPSVASLLTSQYPTVLGITSEPDTLADELVLLPEVLRDHGYATAAIVSHYFLGRKWRFDQGSDWFDQSSIKGHEGVSGDRVTDLALGYLRERTATTTDERPFFLLLHYFDPHYNYLEHPEFRFWVDDSYAGWVVPGLPYTELRDRIAELRDEHLERLTSLYDSEIAYTDHHIGRLLDGLASLGLDDQTLVVFTADHGEELLDHGGIGHGGKLTDEVVRVPLIVRPPGGMQPARRDDRLVGLIDLAPSLLAWLGVPAPAEMAGSSLLSPPNAAAPVAVFSETDWSRERAVVLGSLKLIRNVDTGQRALFDLAADPGETRNLFREGGVAHRRREMGALRDALDQWIEATGAQAGDRVSRELGEEETAALRALGYLGRSSDSEP